MVTHLVLFGFANPAGFADGNFFRALFANPVANGVANFASTLFANPLAYAVVNRAGAWLADNASPCAWNLFANGFASVSRALDFLGFASWNPYSTAASAVGSLAANNLAARIVELMEKPW